MTEFNVHGADLPSPAVHLCTPEGDPIPLAMQDILLTGTLLPIGARLVVRHLFAVSGKKPVEAVYSFMLPRDASMRSFKVQSRKLSIDSELMPREQASDLYEEGLSDGHLSVLAETHRDGLVNLNIGNLQPGEPVAVLLEIVAGVDMRDEGFRFRFPFAVAPVYQPGARHGRNVAGDLEIELPDQFGGAFLPPWRLDPSQLHKVHIDLTLECPDGLTSVSSPSHPIKVEPTDKSCRISLSTAHDVPNRDFIFEVALPYKTRVFSAGQEFAALVGSSDFSIHFADRPRKIVFLIDQSGSMNGLPIEQAVRAIRTCLSGLKPETLFNLIAFSTNISLMERRLVHADAEGLREAEDFLSELTAGGGTDLGPALAKAGRVGGADAEIFLVTDGQVGSIAELIETARATRNVIHVLGIGSASQDRFLGQLARETGGASYFAAPREEVDMAALTLFASIGTPIALEIVANLSDVEGVIEPKPAAAVRWGIPWLVSGRQTSGTGQLTIAWLDENESEPEPICLNLAHNMPEAMEETLSLLRGARLITDAEMGKNGEQPDPAALEALSRTFGLSSTAMSLVAVMKREGDKAGAPPTTVIVPVGLPQDVSERSYGSAPRCSAPREKSAGRKPEAYMDVANVRCSAPRTHFREMPPASFSLNANSPDAPWIQTAHELCRRIQSDGGLDGASMQERALRSLIALLYLNKHEELFSPQIARLLCYTVLICAQQNIPDDLRQILSHGTMEKPECLLPPAEVMAVLAAPYDLRDARLSGWLVC